MGEWESGRVGEGRVGEVRVGEWESGRVGEGRVGEWESGRGGEWERGEWEKEGKRFDLQLKGQQVYTAQLLAISPCVGPGKGVD